MSVADFNVRPAAESKNDALKRAVKTIEDALDTRVNPCENFQKYACGNYKGSSTFSDVFVANAVKQITELRRKDSADTLEPLQQVKKYWNTCVKALDNLDDTLNGGTQVKTIITGLQVATGFNFPLLDGAANKAVTATGFAKAVGWLQNRYGVIAPLVATSILPRLKAPDTGNLLYLEAPFTVINPQYLQDPLFDAVKDQIISIFAEPLQLYIDSTGENVDERTVRRVAEELAQFERAIAQGALDNPGIDRIDNLFTVKDARKAFGESFDYATFLAALAGDDSELAAYFASPDYELSIVSPSNWRKWTRAFEARKNKDGSQIDDSVVLNYIHFRIIYAQQAFLLGDSLSVKSLSTLRASANVTAATRFARHVSRPAGYPEPQLRRAEYELPEWHPLLAAAAITQNELQCAQLAGGYLEFANDRVFLTAVYPGGRHEAAQAGVFEMADGIAKEFRGMLKDLDWLSEKSRAAALDKVDNIQKNILFPDIVYDDAKLVDYYSSLPDLGSIDWLQQMRELAAFNRHNELHQLTAKAYDRTEFGDTSVVNAYYRPTANSITILAAIAQAPFYDIDWPAQLQYGAIGMAVGHEITHGFDNGGVFWDGIGARKPQTWMDPQSRANFNKMAKCVIDEYNGLCLPTNATDEGKICDDGVITQGENIADNGGIRSGYRAYKAYEAKHGAAPPLPGDVVGKFSNDQLFFIAFARTWCDNVEDNADYSWQNEHSPAPLRIFGTLQNYERFKTTYNCPTGSNYAPAKHCEVWHNAPSSAPNADRVKFSSTHKKH